MSNYSIIPISNSFHIEVLSDSPKFMLTIHQQQHIETLWEQANQNAGGKLFNGKIFCLKSFEKDRLIGQFVEYKYYLAQHIDPGLRSVLPIEVISITGITHFEDKVLLGLRSSFVSGYPEHFELAPSGSIDPTSMSDGSIDYTKAIIRELEEETGISPTQIVKISPIAMIQDDAQQLWEICMNIVVQKNVEKETFFPGKEYTQLWWMPRQQLREKMSNSPDRFVPLSVFLYQTFIDRRI